MPKRIALGLLAAALAASPAWAVRAKVDRTGLAWVPPSPNLRTVTQAILYPGAALAEGANVSVGRGTETPFELIGAPWIDGTRLASSLNARNIPGVRFHPAVFRPSSGRHADARCGGVRVELVDRDALDSPAMGLEILSALQRLHPGRFRLDATLGMVGSREVLEAIRRGEDPQAIAARWAEPIEAFRAARSRYLLYPPSTSAGGARASVGPAAGRSIHGLLPSGDH